MTVRGRVQGLDLGPGLVAFLWSVQGPGVNGRVGAEIRADRISTLHTFLVGSGHGGEACTASPDAVSPSAPTVDGARVWYPQLSAACDVYSSTLLRYGTAPVAGSGGPLPGIVLQIAKDGPNLYALVAPANRPHAGPTCADPAAPCVIEQITPPPLSALASAPVEPFIDPAR
jgi:hypothetical protein